MPSQSELTRAQSAASMEATRLHLRLGTTYDAPVDVLSIVRGLGLVLMMQPLDNLLGFYVRRPEAAGIVINSRIPESVQRFTLAHEIGHHVLGHEGTADDHHTLDRFDPNSITEVQAQAFASSLIMPLPLITRALRELPSTRTGSRVTPSDAYLFSRQLGVSYAAGVWALYRQNRLSLAEARDYIKKGALSAKTPITHDGSTLNNARADVWMLTEENDDLSVLCRVGDEIQIQLNEDTSTGSAWTIRSPLVADYFDPSTARNALSWDTYDDISLTVPDSADAAPGEDSGIEVLRNQHRNLVHDPEPEDLLGMISDDIVDTFPNGAGIREVTLVPRKEGRTRLVMELVRPWDAEAEALRAYELDLVIRSRRLGGEGLFAPEPDTWVAEHAVTA